MLQQCPHWRVSVTFRLLIQRAVDLLHSEYSAAVGTSRRIISTAPTVGEYVTMAWRANNDYIFVTKTSVVKSRANSCFARCECRNWGTLCQVATSSSSFSLNTHTPVFSATRDSSVPHSVSRNVLQILISLAANPHCSEAPA